MALDSYPACSLRFAVSSWPLQKSFWFSFSAACPLWLFIAAHICHISLSLWVMTLGSMGIYSSRFSVWGNQSSCIWCFPGFGFRKEQMLLTVFRIEAFGFSRPQIFPLRVRNPSLVASQLSNELIWLHSRKIKLESERSAENGVKPRGILIRVWWI